MKYKISVILPVFNVETYIKESLDSIIRQTIGFEHLEVIMVNDCSTDKSGKIMDEYADKHENFIAINLPENSKAGGKPRNIGMERATSDYLMFLDPDDYFADDACEILYDKITSEDVDIVFGTFTILDEISKKRRFVHAFVQKGGNNEIIAQTIDDQKTFLSSPPSIWTKIFKRKFIEQNKILFPEGIPAQDLVFLTHAFLKAKGIIFINHIIVYYNNLRNDSVSRKRDKNILSGRLRAFYQTYDVCKENGREDYFISFLLKNLLVNWILLFILSDMSNSEKKELLELSWPLFRMCEEYELIEFLPILEHLKPVFISIANKKFEIAILLVNQLVYLRKKELEITSQLTDERRKRKNIENQLKQTRKQLKASQESLMRMKKTEKEILSQHDNLKAQYYETQYLNNNGRPIMQRLISWFPSLYILLMSKTGIKNNLINIKGYHSIKKNHLLDIGYYLKNNSDVRISGKDPIIHYIYHGYKEGRKPNITFDGDYYSKMNIDVQNSKLNPLVHYSLYGIKEKRKVQNFKRQTEDTQEEK